MTGWRDRQGLGLSRPPVLTAVLTALTAATSVVGLMSPTVLGGLARTPVALHGEAWRWITSLIVQDGGLFGTASNLIFLALLGAAAEQVVGRGAMLVCYLTAGLSGQVAGVLWQPYGAGNSVAVCGLAGVLAWSLGDSRAPRWAGSALALWLGALLATWWPPLIVVGVLGAVLDRAVAGRCEPRIRVRVAVAANVVVAVFLIAVANIHGAALAVGTLVGVLPVWRRSRTR